MIEEAAQLLKQGKIVAFPTETVYGIGARMDDPAAVARLFQVKKRCARPLSLHLYDIAQVEGLVLDPPELFWKLARAHLPGPLTLVVRKTERVPDSVTCGLMTVGIRIPSHPVAQALLREVGDIVVATSANLSGEKSACTAGEIPADFADLILDGGPATLQQDSTVISLVDPANPRVLRAGGLSLSF